MYPARITLSFSIPKSVTDVTDALRCARWMFLSPIPRKANLRLHCIRMSAGMRDVVLQNAPDRGLLNSIIHYGNGCVGNARTRASISGYKESAQDRRNNEIQVISPSVFITSMLSPFFRFPVAAYPIGEMGHVHIKLRNYISMELFSFLWIIPYFTSLGGFQCRPFAGRFLI